MNSLSNDNMSLPNFAMRPVEPPNAIQPTPLSSITAPGSNGTLQPFKPGVFASTRLFFNGEVHGPTGEVEVRTAVPKPPFEK